MQPENETAPDLDTADDEEAARKLALVSRITGMSEDELLDALRQAFGEYDGDEPPVENDLPADGQFMTIAFMGHTELTGYVTEVTLGGEPGYHIDLPDRLWGGNPLAWEEYSGKALFSRRPVTEESVRKAWEARLRAAERRRQQEAEWARMQEQRALASGTDDDDDRGDDDQYRDAF